MNLVNKLQIKPGQSIAVLNAPKDLRIDFPKDFKASKSPTSADAILCFVTKVAELSKRVKPFLESAKQRDAMVWMVYPKGGRLGTDLNRDLLWKELEGFGIRPVRQIAIDETWSALRFKRV